MSCLKDCFPQENKPDWDKLETSSRCNNKMELKWTKGVKR